MAEILSLDGQKTIQLSKEDMESMLQQAINILDDVAIDGESGEDIIANILSLDDETFNALAPIFLEEIKKAFNNTDTSLLLVNMMNTSGLKYEDLVNQYQQIFEAIDSNMEEELLSPVKRSFIKQILMTIVNSIGDTQSISKRIVEIPIELMDENAKIPTYSKLGDAAADIYALESYTIKPGEQAMIKTGIKVAIPYGYAILIQPRSGLSAKTKLRICNTPGLIDSGYRGEICVLVENVDSPIKDVTYDKELGIVPLYGEPFTIEAGDRIAQMRLVEVPSIAFNQVSNIGEYESERGEDGFGSTGMK